MPLGGPSSTLLFFGAEHTCRLKVMAIQDKFVANIFLQLTLRAGVRVEACVRLVNGDRLLGQSDKQIERAAIASETQIRKAEQRKRQMKKALDGTPETASPPPESLYISTSRS